MVSYRNVNVSNTKVVENKIPLGHFCNNEPFLYDDVIYEGKDSFLLKMISYTRAVWEVRGLTLLLRVGTLWRCGDGLLF
jgi:hypothetical protein